MVTVYITCFCFKNHIFCQHSVCKFLMIITKCRLYFPCSMNTGCFLRFVSRNFQYYFRPFACLCLETHASLADTLLRRASHLTLPIFIIPVEHISLKANKSWNSQLDQNYAVLCHVPAVNNEVFMLTFNTQWLVVCEQSTQLYKTGNVRTYKSRWSLVGASLVALKKQ